MKPLFQYEWTFIYCCRLCFWHRYSKYSNPFKTAIFRRAFRAWNRQDHRLFTLSRYWRGSLSHGHFSSVCAGHLSSRFRQGFEFVDWHFQVICRLLYPVFLSGYKRNTISVHSSKMFINLVTPFRYKNIVFRLQKSSLIRTSFVCCILNGFVLK